MSLTISGLNSGLQTEINQKTIKKAIYNKA